MTNRQMLMRVRQLAQAKIDNAQEPPWAWYQYMKLIEATDAIINGMAAIKTIGNLRPVAAHQETDLRLKASTSEPDKPPQHHAGELIRMPM